MLSSPRQPASPGPSPFIARAPVEKLNTLCFFPSPSAAPCLDPGHLWLLYSGLWVARVVRGNLLSMQTHSSAALVPAQQSLTGRLQPTELFRSYAPQSSLPLLLPAERGEKLLLPGRLCPSHSHSGLRPSQPSFPLHLRGLPPRSPVTQGCQVQRTRVSLVFPDRLAAPSVLIGASSEMLSCSDSESGSQYPPVPSPRSPILFLHVLDFSPPQRVSIN